MQYNEYQALSREEKFNYFISSLSRTNRTPEYYVDWGKVGSNVHKIELSLNTLNYLIGKDDIIELARELFIEQPHLLEVVPILIASRISNIDVLLVQENKELDFLNLDFTNIDLTRLDEYLKFMEDSGLFAFLQSEIKQSLVDYVYGVEVGLGSNGRKNRSGTVMESIVENFVNLTAKKLGFQTMTQATPSAISNRWGIEIPVDKSNRRFDNAIFDNISNKCYLIETNYYGGGGSKLKAVAGEFSALNNLLKENDNIRFIWVTDGQGWHTSKLPLLEAFEKIDHILNIEMLSNDFLDDILTFGD